MVHPTVRIPIAILILEQQGVFTYRAYSPYFYQSPPPNVDPFEDEQYQAFLQRIYGQIGYDSDDPINNHTNMGYLKEIHTRFLIMPVLSRGNSVFFSTYQHPICHYNPVHNRAPIFFDNQEANKFEEMHPELVHRMCSHQLV